MPTATNKGWGMMYSNGYSCGSNGYFDGDGYGCNYGFRGDSYGLGCTGNGYGVGIDGYGDGNGDTFGNGYGIGIEGDGRGNGYMEDEEEEQLSAIRLLADAIENINFYICQSHILNNKK